MIGIHQQYDWSLRKRLQGSIGAQSPNEPYPAPWEASAALAERTVHCPIHSLAGGDRHSRRLSSLQPTL